MKRSTVMITFCLIGGCAGGQANPPPDPATAPPPRSAARIRPAPVPWQVTALSTTLPAAASAGSAGPMMANTTPGVIQFGSLYDGLHSEVRIPFGHDEVLRFEYLNGTDPRKYFGIVGTFKNAPVGARANLAPYDAAVGGPSGMPHVQLIYGWAYLYDQWPAVATGHASVVADGTRIVVQWIDDNTERVYFLTPQTGQYITITATKFATAPLRIRFDAAVQGDPTQTAASRTHTCYIDVSSNDTAGPQANGVTDVPSANPNNPGSTPQALWDFLVDVGKRTVAAGLDWPATAPQ